MIKNEQFDFFNGSDLEIIFNEFSWSINDLQIS